MTFSIEQFKSAIGSRGGILPANRFLVTFPLPRVILENAGQDNYMPWYAGIARDMEFWCTNANLPGYQLATGVAKRWTYGPDEKRPFGPVYQPIQLTFNADAQADYLTFFNRWTQYIMPHDWYNAFTEESEFQALNGGAGQYDVEYKQNYAVDMTIAVFNQAGDLVTNYVIKEAFPSMVSDMQFDWERQSNKQQFQVAFDYLDWTQRSGIQINNNVGAPVQVSSPGPGSNGVGTGVSPRPNVTVEFPNANPGVEY